MSQRFSVGNVSLTCSDGWREMSETEGILILRSPDNRQQLTLSSSHLPAPAAFDEFKKICAVRLQAERRQLAEGSIEPDPTPFQQGNCFGFVYTGVDRKTRRFFSTCLSLAGRELVTLYLESFTVPPNQHIDTFKTFIANLKRN